MPKDWKDITDDEILNFAGPQTADIARYERIMEKRSIEAMDRLLEGLKGLMQTIYRASQGMQQKTDELIGLYSKISRAQGRQQVVLIVLSIVVALATVAYTLITWQSVAAMRQANQIQVQLLDWQRTHQTGGQEPHLRRERNASSSPRH